MVTEVVGLAAAAALWTLAFVLKTRAERRAILAAPSEWREHPELRDAYAEFLEPTEPWKPSWRSYARLLAGTVVVFLAIAVADFELWFVLVFTAALALAWTIFEFQDLRERIPRFAAEHDLPPVRRSASLSLAYFGSVLLLWLGFYGMSAFAGALLANALD